MVCGSARSRKSPPCLYETKLEAFFEHKSTGPGRGKATLLTRWSNTQQMYTLCAPLRPWVCRSLVALGRPLLTIFRRWPLWL